MMDRSDKLDLLLDALRDLPQFPPPIVLHTLGVGAGDYNLDNELGKELQRTFGTEVIPPVCECEIGAGFWWRVILRKDAP